MNAWLTTLLTFAAVPLASSCAHHDQRTGYVRCFELQGVRVSAELGTDCPDLGEFSRDLAFVVGTVKQPWPIGARVWVRAFRIDLDGTYVDGYSKGRNAYVYAGRRDATRHELAHVSEWLGGAPGDPDHEREALWRTIERGPRE